MRDSARLPSALREGHRRYKHMGRRILPSQDAQEQEAESVEPHGPVAEAWVPKTASPKRAIESDPLTHARNAAAELRSVLKTTRSNDVRDAVQYALDAWEQRVSDLEDAQPTA